MKSASSFTVEERRPPLPEQKTPKQKKTAPKEPEELSADELDAVAGGANVGGGATVDTSLSSVEGQELVPAISPTFRNLGNKNLMG
jgi:hypothetical protein